jgi:hypothetical protein
MVHDCENANRASAPYKYAKKAADILANPEAVQKVTIASRQRPENNGSC